MRWIAITGFLTFCFSSDIFPQTYIYPFMAGGKIGFRNEKDSILIDPVYDYYEAFEKNGNWTVIGSGTYERISNSSTERQVRFKGKFGFIDSAGNIITQPYYDMILDMFENHALVGDGEGCLDFNNWPEGKSISFIGSMGVVHRKGYTCLPIRFKEIKRIEGRYNPYWYALDDYGNSFLYLDSNKLDFPTNVTDISDFSEGRSRILQEGKYGFIDTSGQVVIKSIYNRAKDFQNGKTFVKKGEQYAWIDTAGQEISNDQSFLFDEMGRFSEGYARVKVFDDYGFIRPDSSFLFIPRFRKASSFFNEIAAVSSVDSFGYVRTNGRLDVVCKYYDQKIKFELNPGTEEKLPEFQAPLINWNDSIHFFYPFDRLSFEKLLEIFAESLRWAPWLYYEYPQMLAKVSAGEGTLSGRHLFNMPFLEPGNESWEFVKNTVLLKILSDEKLRIFAWKISRPLLQISFQSMPELHQQVYLDMIDYLERYFLDYDIDQTREFLINHESFFAHEHPDGSISPFRKASAQIDRLILVYQVISVEDVRKWIRKVKKEVSKW